MGSDSTPLMPTIRKTVFGTVIFCSVIILALSAHVLSKVVGTAEVIWSIIFPSFAALGIVASLLALLSLPVMLVMDNMRKGAFTSMIIVELPWLGLLWILFLSTASTASQSTALTFGFSCSNPFIGNASLCREFNAIQAFAYLSWIALLGYIATLLSLSTKIANRGYHRVWYQSVKETEFNAPPVTPAPGAIQTQQHIHAQNSVFSQAGYPHAA